MNTTLNPSVARKMFPFPPNDEHLECPYCGKHPNELEEYVEAAQELNMTAVEYVKSEEGTYCQYTGCFSCTECYIKIGLPANEQLHAAFLYFRMEANALPGQDNDMFIKYFLGEI